MLRPTSFKPLIITVGVPVTLHFFASARSASRSTAEIDFVAQYFGKVSPIEVKAEENLQAKSLKSFYQKYPDTKAIRTSMSDYREEEWMVNLPLYAIQVLGQL